jgi:uncharacterized protein (TIGR04255 family)
MNATERQAAGSQDVMGRRPDLPDFERPPVTEVVLSMQFATLENMKSFHVGLFWARFRSEYPDVSEQAPINAMFETFGKAAQAGPPLQLEQFLSPPMPRYWFEKRGTPDLLQLQQDRLIHNWRKQDDAAVYPRYEALRERFRSEVEEFIAFLENEKIGVLRPNQCEVTYTNIIEMSGIDGLHDRLERITPLWTGQFSETSAADFENAMVQLRFKLIDSDRPVGRVYVSFQPAVLRTDPSRDVIKLDVTARGRPKHETCESAFEFFDFGRRAVVKTFAAVTTPSMHSLWGRNDASN